MMKAALPKAPCLESNDRRVTWSRRKPLPITRSSTRWLPDSGVIQIVSKPACFISFSVSDQGDRTENCGHTA